MRLKVGKKRWREIYHVNIKLYTPIPVSMLFAVGPFTKKAASISLLCHSGLALWLALVNRMQT